MTWQPRGDGEGKARYRQRPLPPAFTQRPDDKRQHASKTFLQKALAQGTTLILKNKVSAVCRVLDSGRNREGDED